MKAGVLPAVLALGLGASGACAADVAVKPLVDARLRYEAVDQNGLPRDAHALTARIRSGVEASADRLSALVEAEATLAIVPRYFDGVRGSPLRPLVADPQNVELNRAQLRWAGPLTLTAGRQLIELADQRFVGSAGFRQNQQTFDAVRAQWSGGHGLSVDLSYAWSARTVNGINGRETRPQAVRGDDLFALVGYPTPVGTLTGFAYLVDEDEAALQGYRLSSRTFGVRLAGGRPLGGAALSYSASYARQGDWHRNPNRYAANYYLGEATLVARGLSGTLGYEVLGADRGAALTSFQTPFASLFKFQGWADKLTTTPPDGVRDLYLGGGYQWKARDTLSLQATLHRFRSDRADRRYGDEVDLLAGLKHDRYLWSARYARYRSNGFATDTDRLWLSLDWAL